MVVGVDWVVFRAVGGEHVEVDGERAGGRGDKVQLARAARRYGRGEVVPVEVDFARLVRREVDADIVTLGNAQIVAGQDGISIDDGQVDDHRAFGG